MLCQTCRSPSIADSGNRKGKCHSYKITEISDCKLVPKTVTLTYQSTNLDFDPLSDAMRPALNETIRIGGVAALGGWMPLHFEVDNLHVPQEDRLTRVLVVRIVI